MRSSIALFILVLTLVGCGTDPFQKVTFQSTDGLGISGRIYGDGDTAVVLAHMFPADQGSWNQFARELADEGYVVLTFDFRGYGDSQGSKEISEIDRDLEGAVDYMRERGAHFFFLIGASMGGTASIKVAARRPVSGVVGLSAAAEFRGLEALEDAGQVDVPKLFITSQDDRTARLSVEALDGSSPGESEVLIIDGADHGTDMLKGSEGQRVKEAILSFLERN